MNLGVQCSMSRAEIVEKVFEPKVGVEIVKFSGWIDEQILHVNLSKHFSGRFLSKDLSTRPLDFEWHGSSLTLHVSALALSSVIIRRSCGV